MSPPPAPARTPSPAAPPGAAAPGPSTGRSWLLGVARAAAWGGAHGALLYGGPISLLTVLHNRGVGVTVRDALALLAAAALLYGLAQAAVFGGIAAVAGRERGTPEQPPRGVLAAALAVHLIFGFFVASYGLTYDQIPGGADAGRWGMVGWIALRTLAVAAAAAVAAWAFVAAGRRLGNGRRRAAVVTAGLAVWALAHAAAAAKDVRSVAPRLERVPVAREGRPVVLVGLDGADWRVLDRLIADGEMPNLAALRARGAWGPLATLAEANSAVLWASIYTGYPPPVHDVLDFYTVRLPGMGRGVFPIHRSGLKELARQLQKLDAAEIVPIDRADVDAPLVWEVVAAAGRSVGVVDGYYYSFPAPPLPEARFFLAYGTDRFVAAAGGAAAAARAPSAALYARPPELLAELGAAVEQDELYWQTSAALALVASHGQPRFLGIYTHQPDAVLHGAWRGLEPERFFGGADRVPQARADLLAIHRRIDGFLGELLPRLDPDTVVIVASDHGQSPTLFHAMESQHRHGPPGILLVAGAGIPPGPITGAEIHDVMPTVLHLLGLPVAADAPGRVIPEAVGGAAAASRISSYLGLAVPGAGAVGRDPAREAEELEKLRALGYIR